MTDVVEAGAYWDGILDDWEPSMATCLWRAHSDAVNIGLLRRWLPPSRAGGRVTVLKTDLFDEAVGTGLYPELSARAGAVVGVDISRQTVRSARQRYPALEATVGDLLRLPFGPGTFDAVVSNSSLDHFDSRAKLRLAVAELARVLRPGGELIITLDNYTNPVVAVRTSRLGGPLRRLGVVPYYVGATYGARGLVEMLGQSGFDVAETRAIMHCPPQLAAHLAAGIAARNGPTVSPEALCRYLRRALRFEAMGRWPTRQVTAHFIAARAVRR